MRTSTLASWIDSAAVASMAEELCPRDEGMHGAVGAAVESGVWVGGRGLRHEKVAVASYPSEEEVSRARLRLEAIRAQARHSGLIDHTLEAVKAEVPGRITPVVDEVDGKTDAAEAGAGEAGAEGDPVGVPAAAGEGPFQEMRREAAPATEVAPGGDAGGAEEAADYVIPQGTLGVRMGSFAVWVAEVTGGADVFVIDGQGYPLVERGGDADLMAAALLLGDASRRASGQVDGGDGVVRMEVGAGMVLSVMACESQYGTLCVCVHGASPVHRELAAKVSAALRVTLGA
ncbi:MAG: hypothetical protein P8J87_03655 [Verrucomicrobiales bacterium]|nr:hypothetical protein [Verrucomicrobiales bacterium]